MKTVRTGRYLSFFALNKELCGEDRASLGELVLSVVERLGINFSPKVI